MNIRHEYRPKSHRVPEWNQLTPPQQQLMKDLADCSDCIDFECFSDAEREQMEVLRDLGWVSLSYRAANGMGKKVILK